MAITLPVVNGSSGTWGTILNAALTDIDTRLTDATSKNTSQDTTLTTLGGRVTTLEGSAGSGGELTVATSATRPAPAVGQIVLETDTGFLYYVASVSGTPTRVPFPGSYLAKLKRATTQTYGNNTAGPVAFTVADFDRLKGWNGTTRYTATVPGIYEFTGAISWVTNTTGYRSVTWNVNGAPHNCTAAIIPAAPGESTVVVARPCVLALNANDYVELVGQQNSGVSLTTDAGYINQPSMVVKYLGYNA